MNSNNNFIILFSSLGTAVAFTVLGVWLGGAGIGVYKTDLSELNTIIHVFVVFFMIAWIPLRS